MREALNRAALLSAMDRTAKRTLEMDMPWEWPCGVAYYGLCEAARAADRPAYLDAIRERVNEFIDLGLPVLNVNTCAMGHCLLTLSQTTDDPRYRDILAGQMDYLRHHALRFGESVLQHTVSANNDFPGQAWADTLFMAAFLMLRVGVAWKDDALVQDALHQYAWHIEFLQDKRTGLWYHGYNSVTDDHMSGVYWGRANAWAAYTMAMVGAVLPEAYLYPTFMDVNGSLDEQLLALKPLQTENGLWRTILDDETSYEEVSASAGIAAAMAVHGNPLHRKYVLKALQGVMDNISPEGRVMNVSAGTAVMKDRAGYRGISCRWTQGWGQGLALALLAAALPLVPEEEKEERA